MATSASPDIANNVTDIATAKPRNKTWLWIVLALLLGTAGSGTAWWWFGQDAGKHEQAKPLPPAPPVFVELDSFTVNLEGDRILQAGVTLQVKNADDAEQIKLYMPQVKSRLLLLMSAQTIEQLHSAEGKHQLATAIALQLRTPFTKDLAAPQVTGVYFTAFVIQ